MKPLLTFMLCCLAATTTQACDHCACGAANYYIGVMPHFNRHFAGLRYRAAGFQTQGHDLHSGHAGHTSNSFTQERFQVAEAWGRFYPTRKLQVLAFVPYQQNRQTAGDEQYRRQGLGDIVLLANYNIFGKSSATDNRRVRHSAWLGGGIKAPTGRYRFEPSEQGQTVGGNANLQLGTGSWDLLVNGQYTLRFRRLGFSADATYRHNGVNDNDYHFGDRLSGGLTAFYVRQFGPKFALMPSAGLYGEYSDLDRDRGSWQGDTGGHLLCAQTGLDLYFNGKTALNIGWQRPLFQHLAGGQISAASRWMIGTMIMF